MGCIEANCDGPYSKGKDCNDQILKPESGSFSTFESCKAEQKDQRGNSAHDEITTPFSSPWPPCQMENSKPKRIFADLPFRGLAPAVPVQQRPESPHNACNVTSRASFNLLEALVQQDEVLRYLTTRMLPPRDLLNLYCISKGFHFKVNLNPSAYILSSARTWISVDDPCPTAPLSLNIPSNFLSPGTSSSGRFRRGPVVPDVLPFGPFQRFCHRDPTDKRIDESISPEVMQALLFNQPGRGVPDFRYLFFLVNEVAAASAIIRMLWADYGLRLPADSLRTMAKLALLMNARRNSTRMNIVHNEAWLTDADLFRANTIFMKLDMAFTDPLQNLETSVRKTESFRMRAKETGRGMRQLVCAQPGWTVCARVLARQDGYSSTQDFMRLWTEWMFLPDDEFGDGPIWGLKPDQMGRLSSEEVRDEHGQRFRGENKLMSIDEFVTREGVRRGLDMQEWLVEMMVCGFIDPVTGKSLDGRDAVKCKTRHPANNQE